MKKMVLSLIVFVTITASLDAQTRRITPDKTVETTKENRDSKKVEGGKHRKTEHRELAKKLHFTDAQRQELKSINSDFKNRMQDLNKNNNTMSAEELKSKKKELVRERMQKTMALLTPEQKSKMEQLKNENRGKRKMSPAKKIEEMKASLGLSNEQVEKMNTQNQVFTSRKESIMNDQSLTMEQKKEQLKLLKDEKMNSFKSSLTSDQLKKMEEMKRKRSMKAAS